MLKHEKTTINPIPITTEAVTSQSSREEVNTYDEAIPSQLRGIEISMTTRNVDSLPKITVSPCCSKALGEAPTVVGDGVQITDHITMVGRGQVCVRCDARLYTFSALREHEHPEMFSCGVEQHPVSAILEQQLEEMAEYELRHGANVKTMARDLGLTESQVRSRRKFPVYKIVVHLAKNSRQTHQPPPPEVTPLLFCSPILPRRSHRILILLYWNPATLRSLIILPAESQLLLPKTSLTHLCPPVLPRLSYHPLFLSYCNPATLMSPCTTEVEQLHTFSKELNEFHACNNVLGESLPITTDDALCASSLSHDIEEIEVLPSAKTPPSRSFSPELHCSQVAGPSHVNVPLVECLPCIDKHAAETSAEPDVTTVTTT